LSYLVVVVVGVVGVNSINSSNSINYNTFCSACIIIFDITRNVTQDIRDTTTTTTTIIITTQRYCGTFNTPAFASAGVHIPSFCDVTVPTLRAGTAHS
jgi:hypothetical protein